MAQGYYTLLEAAQFVGLPPDELKQMAQRNQIRSFQDRGTLRFRIQDVQELARRRGAMSDPELVLGEAPAPPRSGVSPRPESPRPDGPRSEGPRTPRSPSKPAPVAAAPQEMPDVFDFDLGGDNVDVGQELFAKIEQPSSKSRKAGSGAAPRTPSAQGKSGSDSDVKLVAEGDDFSLSVGSDSDVKLVTGDSGVKLTPPPGMQPPSSRSGKPGSKPQPPSSGSKSPSKLGPRSPAQPGPKSPSRLGPITPAPPKSPSKLGPADSSPQKKPSRLEVPQPADSGVRLVPADSDSDVRIVGAGSDEVPLGEAPPPDISDSDIRLERIPEPSPQDSGEEMMLTEEINLDEELRRQEAALKQQPTPSKLRPKSSLKFPTSSPFELSDPEMQQPSSAASKAIDKQDSSDFDLQAQKPVKDDSSDFDVQPLAESSDFSIEVPLEEQALGEPIRSQNVPSSGISLQNPVDAGISLEEGQQGDDSVDFDLSLETEATPKPVQHAAEPSPADSDSEFELSLEDSGQGPLASEDSEFELTLDDSGQLADMEAASASATDDVGERDIFETDFEVPDLDDSKEAKLDTDLDSSDFDIALDDSDLAVEDESGSQVVALEEEPADDSAETVAGEDIEVEVEEEAAFADLGVDGEPVVEVEEEEETGPVREKIVEKMIEPAPWGAMPVVFMLPCVVIMILVGLMGFELIQSSTGYKQAGFLTRTFGELLGQKVK